MASSIGEWNPAWGPEPEWRGPRSRRANYRRWRISCACSEEEWIVVGPDSAVYTCARCGSRMQAKRVRDTRGKKPSRTIEVGERYGRMTVTEVGGTGAQGRRVTCRCDCGETAVVWAKHLRDGSTKSCGCYRRERAAAHPWRRSYK